VVFLCGWELISSAYPSGSGTDMNEGSVLVACLLLSLAIEKNLPGKKCTMSGFRAGTLAQTIPVPTSTTDQLRLETQA
jgi:hypothetical protein